jgi:hypothetical protein
MTRDAINGMPQKPAVGINAQDAPGIPKGQGGY